MKLLATICLNLTKNFNICLIKSNLVKLSYFSKKVSFPEWLDNIFLKIVNLDGLNLLQYLYGEYLNKNSLDGWHDRDKRVRFLPSDRLLSMPLSLERLSAI